MLNVFFDIIVYPIRLFLECVYAVLYLSIFKNNILVSLAGLSLTVNILCLPLYAKAEQLQKIERGIQKKLSHKAASIKKHFFGDERYLMLSMYYRENHYHPIMALRSSLSLLIQIPFFIAAYSFLVHLDSLSGKSLFFIPNLAAPDSFFKLRGFSVNILPIIMTIINLAASYIYAKEFSIKEKIQLYGMAAVFLVLLYNSPSALVLYWTMNNIFSLGKNILSRTKKPFLAVYLIGCFLLFLFMIYVLFIRYNMPMREFRNKFFAVSIFALFLGIPLYVKAGRFLLTKPFSFLRRQSTSSAPLFIASCVAITLLIGFFIPANLIASDPSEFMNIQNIKSPLQFLYYSGFQSIGLFFFWPLCLFFFAPRLLRRGLSLAASGVALCGYANFFIFYRNYGIISQDLNFNIASNEFLAGPLPQQIINLLFCLFVFTALFFAFRLNREKLAVLAAGICSAGVLILLFFRISVIYEGIDRQREFQERITGKPEQTNEIKPIFPLSRNGKNVVIIMLDRAINSYFPLICEQRPDVKEAFAGFTYYKNTVSFYRRTIFGTPPLFGGYEYSVQNMDKRPDKEYREKHNEALLLLPTIFKSLGYTVTVTDMPYTDYENGMDPEFFLSRGINAYNTFGTCTGKYLHDVLHIDEYPESLRLDKLLQRNLLLFSILESSVYSMRDIIYFNGRYWSTEDYNKGAGVPRHIIDSYTVLYYLPELTSITTEEPITEDPPGGPAGAFNIIVNNLTHREAYLQMPDFTVQERTSDAGENFFGDNSFKYYHVNAASYILLSKWFNYLRREKVWDNTKIIIVSDHGDSSITAPGFSSWQNNHVLPYNPILLVKDFNAEGEITTSDIFMTNADTPLMALESIMGNPVNPFTKKQLKADKEKGIYIYTEGNSNASYYSGNTILEDNSFFYHVKDSVFDPANWTELKYRDFKNIINRE
jgi:YidC/Oxa1 family membrane protein insertase